MLSDFAVTQEGGGRQSTPAEFFVVAIGCASNRVFVYSAHTNEAKARQAAEHSRACISLYEFEVVDCRALPPDERHDFAVQSVRLWRNNAEQ